MSCPDGSVVEVDGYNSHDDDNLMDHPKESAGEKVEVINRQPQGSTRLITVEPAVIGSMFFLTLYSILSKEYFYQRIASDYNFTRNSTTESSCGNTVHNESDPDYQLHQKVSVETAALSLYLDISTFIPELFANIVYGSWGDRVGRKTPINISLFGFVVLAMSYVTVVIFNLPLYYLLIGHVISGLLGDFGNLLGCSFSYLSDVTTSEQRTLRMAVLETGIGIGGFISSTTSGLWTGFRIPYYFLLGLAIFNLLYSICFLPANDEGKQKPSFRNLLSKEPFLHMYQVMRPHQNNRHITLILYAICFCVLIATGTGMNGIVVIYTVGVPFCWDSLLIGILSGLGQVSFFVSLLILKLFPAFSLQPKFVMLSITSTIVSSALFAFSKTTWMMFLAGSFLLLYNLASPIIRSQSSRVVSPGEVGSVFAVLACAMAIGQTLGTVIFQGVFAATIRTNMPGAAFLIAAGLLLITIPLYWTGYHFSGLNRDSVRYDTFSDDEKQE